MTTPAPAGTAAADPSRPSTAGQAWSTLLSGNERFVAGRMAHPSQDAARRAELSAGQSPFAVVLGCSDSRVPPEIVFDQGLGDLFVVRTAGHVLDSAVLGSIEYGVGVLGAPLVVVLGHDSCGAVRAAADALTTGRRPQGFIRAVVDRVIPSIVTLPEPVAVGGTTATADAGPAPAGEAPERAALDPDTLGREHVRNTVEMLLGYSAPLRAAVEQGLCAVAGLEYTLAGGRVHVVRAPDASAD